MRRPPGRPPLNHEWCPLKGHWVFNEALAEARRRKKEVARLQPQLAPPKRGRSAYMLFIMDERRKLKAGTDPESVHFKTLRYAKDQHCVLSRRWREAPHETRVRYQAKSDAEKAVAKTARRDFASTAANRARTTLQSLVDKLDDPPRRPPPPFLLFAKVRRPEVTAANPHLRPPEVIKVISGQWWALLPEQRTVWTDRHRELQKEYQLKMEPLRAKHKLIVEAEEEARQKEMVVAR